MDRRRLREGAAAGRGAVADAAGSALGGGARAVLEVLEGAGVDLAGLERNLEQRAAALEAEAQEAEAALGAGARGSGGGGGSGRLWGGLEALEEAVAQVSEGAARVGDRLQAADARRRSAEEAASTIEHLVAFGGAGEGGDAGGFQSLPALFTREGRELEAAREAKRLLRVARAMGNAREAYQREGVGGGSGAESAADRVVANVVAYCNRLENRALDRFDRAGAAGDAAEMRASVELLQEFNGGASLVSRYVASRPMFIDADRLLSLGPFDEDDYQAAERALGRLFKQTLEALRREAGAIGKVFPRETGSQVLDMLVQRTLEQCVQSAVSTVLESLHTTHEEGAGGGVQALRKAANVFKMTQQLLEGVGAVLDDDAGGERAPPPVGGGAPASRLNMQNMLSELFQSFLHDYPALELESLASLCKEHFSSDDYGGGGAFSEEVLPFCSEAVGRCKLFMSPRDSAQCIAEVVCAGPGPDGGGGGLLHHANLHLKTRLERTAEKESEPARPSRAKNARQMPWQVDVTPVFRQMLVGLKRATSIWEEAAQFAGVLVSNELSQSPLEAQEVREALERSEGKFQFLQHGHMDASLELVFPVFDATLEHFQRAEDFCPNPEDLMDMGSSTRACTEALQLARGVEQAAREHLEENQLLYVRLKLGFQMYDTFLAHLHRYKFNPTGGLRLKQDIHSFSQTAKDWDLPKVSQRFDEMGDHANMLIVAPESLASLVDTDYHLDHGLASEYIQLRSDYTSAVVGGQSLSKLFEK